MYYVHHGNAERFAWNGTLRERNETLWEGNETFCERNALNFWERNTLYALASFSIFHDIPISSHGESAFRLSSLRQNENKSLSHLIRTTCLCVIFFDLKRTWSVKIINIITVFKRLCLHGENDDPHLDMFTVLKIINLIDCWYKHSFNFHILTNYGETQINFNCVLIKNTSESQVKISDYQLWPVSQDNDSHGVCSCQSSRPTLFHFDWQAAQYWCRCRKISGALTKIGAEHLN